MSKKKSHRSRNPKASKPPAGSKQGSTANKRTQNLKKRSKPKPKWITQTWTWLTFGLVVIIAAGAAVYTQAINRPGVASPDEITVTEAYTKYKQGTFLLDVRTQEEWDDFHIPNTTLVPLDQLESRLDEIPEDEEIVVVCRSGNRSQTGRDILRGAGFRNVSSMAGGVTEWRSAGYPTE